MAVSSPLSDLSLDDLRARTSIKWRLYRQEVLPVWVAEMDASPAVAVVEAVTAALARGDTGYSAGSGSYVEALSDFARTRWGWAGPNQTHTAIVPDVMLGVTEMLRLATGAGDPVVVNSPVYPPFYAFITSMERRPVAAPLGADGRLDLAVLEETFAQVTSGGGRAAYLLCSPHNPTGTVHTEGELTAVAALAEQYRVQVVADEIHAPLVYPDATFVPYLSVPGGENGLSLMSASKGWNLAGLKAAVAIAGEAAADVLARLPEEVGHGASHVAAIAHTAAFAHGREWLDALLADLDTNRTLLRHALEQQLPQVRYRPGQATYLAWLDCRELGSADPARDFLAGGQVALTSGLPFGAEGAGFARFNFATSPALVREAVDRMATATRSSSWTRDLA